MTDTPTTSDALDQIVDSFSVHRPKGQAKGTLARREMKNKLHKCMAYEQRHLLEQAIERLPKEAIHTPYSAQSSWATGWNECLERTTVLLQAMKEEL